MTTLLSSPAVQTLAPFRLRRHADYQRVYQASRKHQSASLSYFFRVRSIEELPPARGPRIGLTVGKVMGKAVARNRMKRRLREAVRLHLSLLHEAAPAVHNLDLVLHPRRSVATMEFAALEREVAKLFAQVVAMAEHPQPSPPPRLTKRLIKVARIARASTAPSKSSGSLAESKARPSQAALEQG